MPVTDTHTAPVDQARLDAPTGTQLNITAQPATVVNHYPLSASNHYNANGDTFGITVDQPDTFRGVTTTHHIDLYLTLEDLARLLSR